VKNIHYSDQQKNKFLDKYKELFLNNDISSLNEFIDRQDEFMDLDRELKYSTFYKWSKRRDDTKDLKAEPVQQTKNHDNYKLHKSVKNQEGKEEKGEEKGEEKEGKTGGDKLMNLEKRIEEVDRIETKNRESKDNQDKKDQVKNKFNFNKLYVGVALIIFTGLSIFFINKSSKNKEVINTDDKTGKKQREKGKRKYSRPQDY
jgi:hypothetical protein